MSEREGVMRIGAHYLGKGAAEFVLWAPRCREVTLRLPGPGERLLPMARQARGYWRTRVTGVFPGCAYLYRLDGERERPDPASARQSEGVHGPSRLVDHGAFAWHDGDWHGLPWEEWVLYELHVGTFSPEGTFAAVIPRLAALRELGVTALELMPVAAFPGRRNWGYDGACPFAVQESYGGPEGLKRMVDACHEEGLAVVLDVVYNHLGPEGNYLREFGPYFTDRYRTPWGEAVNFDGPGCDEVRHYFIENACGWLRDYHLDALRLDAVHAIFDFSATPFLQELAATVAAQSEELGRPCRLIAESDLNDVRLLRPPQLGGFGLHAQWHDDFHHALHTLLTGESRGYYADFGRPQDLVKALREGFVYDGRHSFYRDRRHGSSSADCPGRQFVACTQNHDQVGNRLRGERLVALAGLSGAKLAAGTLLLAPYVPLLFMGEEYGEKAPFLYFVDFADSRLAVAVREGRKQEFAAFAWGEEPPDPGAFATFARSRLDWTLQEQGEHRLLRDFYRELLALRRALPAPMRLDKAGGRAELLDAAGLLLLQRRHGGRGLTAFFNFADRPLTCPSPAPAAGRWRKRLDAAASRWQGPGATLPGELPVTGDLAVPPRSFALYLLEA